jgi:hypothetical protein
MPLASATALEGLGFPAQLAALLGAEYIKQNGNGTTQAAGTITKSKSVELNPSGGNTAFTINQDVGISQPVFFFNSSATTAVVFVPLGDTLNGSLNGSLSIAQNKGAWFWQYKNLFWASVLTN